jgi:hypothetical protein
MSDKEKRRRSFLSGRPIEAGKLEKVNPDDLKPGPIRHPGGLDQVLTKWARSLYERIGFHLYPSFEQWELGFMRDAQPQREMFVWEAIAAAYETYLKDHPGCDKEIVATTLAGLSAGGTFDTETPETDTLRALWQRTWGQFTVDPEAKFREIARQLQLDE